MIRDGHAALEKMVDLMARIAPSDGEFEASVPGLHFSRRSAPGKMVHLTQWPCLALVVQGAKTVTVGDTTLHYAPGDYLLVSMDLPVGSAVVEAKADEPYFGIGMAIRPEALHDAIARASRSAVSSDKTAALSVTVADAPPALLDAVLRMLQLQITPDDIHGLAPLIEQEILYRILQGPTGDRLRRLSSADTAAHRIGKAIGWLKQNYTRPLRIVDLADTAGISVSSFHHNFKAMTAMTPIQYQKRLRLHEARRLMMVEGMDVGSAGYAVGYESISQFGREYRRLYGVTPSKDTNR